MTNDAARGVSTSRQNSGPSILTGSCRLGMTRHELQEALGDRLPQFDRWMSGQTQGICDGRWYDHEARVWVPDGCGPHGVVAYRSDFNRFIEFTKGRPVDWD